MMVTYVNGMHPTLDRNRMKDKTVHMSASRLPVPFAFDMRPRTMNPVYVTGQVPIALVNNEVSW